MKSRILAAASALFMALSAAGQAEAACNCELPSAYPVVRDAHASVVRTQIIYGDRRAPSRTTYVAPVDTAPAYAPEPVYNESPAYYDYGYGYAPPVAYWGGYGYRRYGYRPSAYRPNGYGWRGGYARGADFRGSAYRPPVYRGRVYGHGGPTFVGGAGWRR